MATIVTKIIREDGTGDYTSLLAWEAGEQKDLTLADEIARAQIEGTWAAAEGTRTIDAFTADATRYVEIEAVGDARHSGVWSTTAWRCGFLTVGDFAPYSRVIGLQCQGARTNGSYSYLRDIICAGQFVGFTGTDVVLENVVAYATVNNAVYRVRSSGYIFRNCVAYGGATGFGEINGGTCYNCVAYGQVDGADWSGWQGFRNMSGDYNASWDSTAPGANSILLVSDPFEDSATDDFRPAAGSPLVDAGTDLSAYFTTDIVGTARPQGSAWDIGAFEATSGGDVPPATLAPAGLAHTHALDSIVLAQSHVLAVGGLAHGHGLEAPTLSVAAQLAVDGLAHGHSLDAPPLSVGYLLAPAGLAHAHVLDAPAVTVAYLLDVAELGHAHAIGAPSLTLAYLLAVDELLHGHVLEAPALAPAGSLDVGGLTHLHRLDAVALTQAHLLAATDALHGHGLDGVVLTSEALLAVGGLLHGHTADNVLLGGLIASPDMAFIAAARPMDFIAAARLIDFIAGARAMTFTAE